VNIDFVGISEKCTKKNIKQLTNFLSPVKQLFKYYFFHFTIISMIFDATIFCPLLSMHTVLLL